MQQAVVFDIGGVLVPEGTRRKDFFEFVKEVVAVSDYDSFLSAFWRYRDAWDLGVNPKNYWTRVLADAGLVEEQITDEIVTQLSERDGQSCIAVSTAAESLIELLSANNSRLYILSNAPKPMATQARQSAWFKHFHGAVFSSEVLIKKPNPEIYRFLENQYEVKNPIFFDDRLENVLAAKACGWDAIHFTTIDNAVSELITRGFDIKQDKVKNG